MLSKWVSISFLTLAVVGSARAASITNEGGVTVTMEEGSGNYAVQTKSPAWTFAGTFRAALKNVTTKDETAESGAITHVLQAEVGETGVSVSVRLAEDQPTILFGWTSARAADVVPLTFPSFYSLPEHLRALSYSDNHFADPSFTMQETGTPYVLFDEAADAAVISPAANFMVARMTGRLDSGGSIGSGLNKDLRKLPAGFTHETLMTVGHGVHETCLAWGHALSSHLHAPRPTNDADPVLRYLGYWTDNGAAYYYNYDPQKGYTGTLEALIASYREKKIPIRYLQLDSWWYQKSLTGYKGEGLKSKNSKLPEESWNRYGGTLEYKAHPALFPNGLDAWQKSINLPLVVHARWIDLDSPYHEKYKITGIAATDPKYWSDIAGYLARSGVTCYEQDWLNFIYDYSPELQTTVDAGNAFADGMAKGCADQGLTMQYCMAPARFFLQGAKYPNLTTIRVSDDRFERARWNNFFYVSMLAEATGKWPWVDVYKSTETENVLLSVLSAGAVGGSDAIGKEDRGNLMRTARSDGVLIKPDSPIVPVDASIVADGFNRHQPLLAATSTTHDAGKTIYAFAYMRPYDSGEVAFTPASLGATGAVYLYAPGSHAAKLLQPGDVFTDRLSAEGSGFYVLIPVGKSGIAFAGDEGKFVGTGKQRIAAIADDGTGLLATVLAAPNEGPITLDGFSEKPPIVTASHATADAVVYEEATHHFRVQIHPDETAPIDHFSADPIHRITVRVAAK